MWKGRKAQWEKKDSNICNPTASKLVVLMPVCFSVPPLPLPFSERKIKLFSTFWGQSLFSTKLCDGFYTGLLF